MLQVIAYQIKLAIHDFRVKIAKWVLRFIKQKMPPEFLDQLVQELEVRGMTEYQRNLVLQAIEE